MRFWYTYVLAATALFPLAATASEKVSGSFTALHACEGFQSIRNKTNPGQVKTTPGTVYRALEINSRDWDWIRVEIPGADQPARWVARSCGEARLDQGSSTARQDQGQCNIKNQHDSYVLAISWQPGFCEHVPFEGKKPECDALARSELKINHLTLHGLWPNKMDCGTRYGNCPGPALDLDRSTIAEIAPWMPNFHYETSFGRHEWKKHGTCQNRSDDEYFLTSVKAVKIVNDSAVGRYVKDNLGKTISINRFFEHIRSIHGEQVANRISLICTKGKYLQEIRLSLPVDFRTDGGIEQLAHGTGPKVPRASKCGSDQIYIERAGPG